ncbi:MAG: Asp-tRNA(Asn)/Glu-tRNA(Gln) amidotransferase subunit GatA [Coriobacteriia bacterium]|nr:Asp-tRNA(Asn)/Glu-tRNA(Gln) amidotransferase subunit GatA [Coriobacteriia bacterium]
MSRVDIAALSAAQISALVTSKTVSAREVAQSALDRIEQLDESLHAFNQVTPELAYKAADELDAKIATGATVDELGPLAGAPVAFKDNMNLLGTRTTCSSRMLEKYESMYDCTAVRKLLDVNTLPLGKLNMDEFAFGSSTENSAFGPTKNPWDTDRVPGGSSGGSAAAVASGMVSATLGSDTGGSIRQPGAFTGTVALKPTYGRVSRYGCVAFASSLDQIGPFSKTVEDCALVLNAISGKDSFDATSVVREPEDFTRALKKDVKGMKIAVATDMLDIAGLDPEIKEGVLNAAEQLAAAGAHVGEVTLPNAEYGLSAYYIVGPAEASSNLARLDGIRYGLRVDDATDVLDLYMRSRSLGFGPETIRRIMIGTYALSAGYYDAYYGQAQKARTVIKQDFDKAFADYDVILMPTTPTTAFKLGEKTADPLSMYLSDVFTIPVNLAGNVGLSIPMGCSKKDGMPMGLQLIGNYFEESKVLTVASTLEELFKFDSVPARLG